ncbi:hypothetical protein SAMD00019534_091180 [Acytostelium subglobosum LB1]|uniref:hypothetical protein n=1 Tax=Acytostelium subglobosum LB1 TaxID=1410327 RepID=UPI000644C1D0|nr:hypothetical protein SAMD00019534_091180 [Acytostelium subglobosum LB1]GAM25943.1 hypothetical protein SAMD00019534_091180 [Acytostelium subglobosum LB1]|eukprot:XP_012750986.1 hypothetical protein SAMD00019534_091180 [Acytostelium subglobosum LB1]
MSNHFGHVHYHVDELKSEFFQPENLKKHMEQLWTSLKPLYTQRQAFLDNEDRIGQVFHELHQQLALEEHKLRKPIVKEREKVDSAIESIISEIQSINSICLAQRGGNNLSDHDHQHVTSTTDIIVESINPDDTLTSFIQSNPLPMDDDDQSPMTRIALYLAQFKDPGRNDHVHDLAIRFEPAPLRNQIMRTIHDAFEMVEGGADNKQSQFQADNFSSQWQVFSLDGGGGIHLFDPAASNTKWMRVNWREKENRYNTLQSAAAAIDENVYIFGGEDRSVTYSRFSMSKQRVDFTGDIGTGQGGSFISTCYDGENYIYLVGGHFRYESLTRIDRFDIRTGECQRIGCLGLSKDMLYYFYSFIYKDVLYAVTYNRNLVITFNLTTMERRQATPDYADGIFKNIWAMCYDDANHLYILKTDHQLIKLSLQSRKYITLATLEPKEKLSSSHNITSMVYLTSNRGKQQSLYLLGGLLYGTHQYSIQENCWTVCDESNRDGFERHRRGSCRVPKKQYQQQVQ